MRWIVEQLVMSAGVIQPDETQARLQTLAESARANGLELRTKALEPSE